MHITNVTGSAGIAIIVAVFAPLIGFHFAVSKVQQYSNVEWKPTRTVKLLP
jgi:hypothetical protein